MHVRWIIPNGYIKNLVNRDEEGERNRVRNGYELIHWVFCLVSLFLYFECTLVFYSFSGV